MKTPAQELADLQKQLTDGSLENVHGRLGTDRYLELSARERELRKQLDDKKK